MLHARDKYVSTCNCVIDNEFDLLQNNEVRKSLAADKTLELTNYNYIFLWLSKKI
jgi:hypothetical protein